MKYPLSKYPEANYYPLLETLVPSPPRADNPEETTSNASDRTEIYWPIDEPGKDGNENDTPKKRADHFNIQVHGLKKHKPKYYFRCKMNGCEHTFYTLKGWNIHHRAHHKGVILKCNKCKKRFTTPSAHRAHCNAHTTIQFTCETYWHGFAFNSALCPHGNVHSKI